jgi:hypothetical protein
VDKQYGGKECVFLCIEIFYFLIFFMATTTKSTSEKKLWIGNLDKRLTEYAPETFILNLKDIINIINYLYRAIPFNVHTPPTDEFF